MNPMLAVRFEESRQRYNTISTIRIERNTSCGHLEYRPPRKLAFRHKLDELINIMERALSQDGLQMRQRKIPTTYKEENATLT